MQLLTSQCQSKPADPPKTQAQKDAQQCFDNCSDANIPVCTELSDYFYKIITPGGCFLKTAATVGGEKVCDAGTPCTCEFAYLWDECQSAGHYCNYECRKQFGPNPEKETLDNQMCDEWNGMGGLDWWKYMRNGTQIDNGILEAILQQSPEYTKVIKAFKDDGAALFESNAKMVIDWLEYYSGIKFDKDSKEAAIKDTLFDLANAAPCPGNNPDGWLAQDSAEEICWFPQMVGYSGNEAKLSGAHEAIHALEWYLFWDKPGILDLAVQHAKEDAMLQEADWYAYMKDNAGFLSHWVLKVLNSQVGILDPGYGGDDKDYICN